MLLANSIVASHRVKLRIAILCGDKPLSYCRSLCVLLTGLLAVGGCSKGSNLPRTVPASGIVTLDGKPVDGAQVVFVPAGDAKTGATGVTNASGKFSLRAYPEKDGAIPGEYQVQVSKTIKVELDGKKGSLDGGDPVRFEYGVPAKYTGAKTSGLKVTIPENGIKDINLALMSK
jgi:hypothetical protein